MLKGKPIILVDGMNLYHRGYHKFTYFENGTGIKTGGIYGMISSISKYRNDFDSSNIIVCWDSRSNKRKKSSSEYKKNRKKNWTEDMKYNFFHSLKICKKLFYYSGIIQIIKKGMEADDLIWMFTFLFKRDVIIVSNDKDFLQLVNDTSNIKVLRPVEDKLMSESDVLESIGVKPKLIPYYLAIVGDKSDNVSGVYNYGRKKALSILRTDKPLNRNYFLSVFNKDEYKQFVFSYRLVKLGYKCKLDFEYKMKNKISIGNVTKILKDLNIKKFSPIEIKQLSNISIKKRIRSYYEQSKGNVSG